MTRAKNSGAGVLNIWGTVLAPAILVFVGVGLAGQESKTTRQGHLEIVLPSKAVVKSDTPTLGQVCVIEGDESLKKKADGITLGRISVPNQEIVLDRSTILGRLAANGIAASRVNLIGADQVKIKQYRQAITGTDFAEAARAFLKDNLPAAVGCRPSLDRMPKELVVPENARVIELLPRVVRMGGKNQVKVEVAVLADGAQIAVREVSFRLKYYGRRAVALRDISPGTIISPENVRVERILADSPEAADFKAPYGLVAQRRIRANTTLRDGAAGPAKPQIIIERNQAVVIRIERPNLLVSTIGKTLQQGSVGECIKVRNVDSKRVIMARVNEDGTVEPVY